MSTQTMAPASDSHSPGHHTPRRDIFGHFAAWTAHIAGGRWAFTAALGSIVVWGLSGPFFHYSEDWQLVINTSTTIVTFLMVFLIQNAQNRESKAIHLKLDEVIRSLRHAHNELIDIEHLTEDELDLLARQYHRLAEDCRKTRDTRRPPARPTGHP